MKKAVLVMVMCLMVISIFSPSPISANDNVDAPYGQPLPDPEIDIYVRPAMPFVVNYSEDITFEWSIKRFEEEKANYFIEIHEFNKPDKVYKKWTISIPKGRKEVNDSMILPVSKEIFPIEGSYQVEIKYSGMGEYKPFSVKVKSGTLEINKFYDYNKNKAQDPDEQGLAGWTFKVEYRDNPASRPFWMTTESDGICTREKLDVGKYRITEEEKEGCWMATTPKTMIAEVKDNQTTVVPFGNYEEGTLKITKYNDTNNNRKIDSPDEKLPGWVFQVTYPDDKTSNYTTDGNGEIKIDVPVGTYTVKEQLKKNGGWIAITPIEQRKNVKQCEEIPVDFLNAVSPPPPGILIQKFNDTNRNRVLDDSDKGAPGWEFKVTDPDGETTTHFTNDTGEIKIEIPRKYEGKVYTIEEVLKPGCWKPVLPIRQTAKGESKTVQFLNIYEQTVLLIQKFNDTNRNRILDDTEKLSGWEFQVTYPDGKTANYITDSKGEIEIKVPPGSYTVKEILKPNWTAITPIIQNKNVAECKTNPVIFHNLFNISSLLITKYYDHNMNGERDSDEEGLEKWEFKIEYPNGRVETVFTDPDGIYKRIDPPPGKYTITEQPQQCWKESTPRVRHDVEITADRGAEVEFGNFKVGTLTIYKFNDTDHNGVWDAGELPLPNWEFKVKGPNGVIDITRYTDDKGRQIVELPANLRYNVSETIPVGWRNSTPHTQSVYINPCEDTPAIFGNYRYTPINIYKFNDTNGNGIRDSGEEGLSGWDFWIHGPNVDDIFTTDENGKVRYEDAIPGQYRIEERIRDDQRRKDWKITTPPRTKEVVVEEGQKVNVEFGNAIIYPCDEIYPLPELVPRWHNTSDENLVVSKYVDPRIVHCDNHNPNEGKIINVTLRVSVFAGMPPTDLVIAVDTSGSLLECSSSSRAVLEAISEGITEYIANNEAKFGENVRIGLVSWDEDIDEIVNLTTNYSNVTAACKRLSINAEEDTLYPVGLNGSIGIFDRGPRENVTKMIVFITDARGTTDGLSNYSRLPDTSGYLIHAITVCTEQDSDNFKMLKNFTSQHSGVVRSVSESSDELAKELTTLTVSSIERRVLNNVTVIETLPKYLRVLNWTYSIPPTSPEHINRDGIDWSTETMVWEINDLSSDQCWENTFQAIFCCRMPAEESHPIGMHKNTSEVRYTDPTNSSITRHLPIPEGGIWIQPRPWWERVPVWLWALLSTMATAILALAIYCFRRTPKQET